MSFPKGIEHILFKVPFHRHKYYVMGYLVVNKLIQLYQFKNTKVQVWVCLCDFIRYRNRKFRMREMICFQGIRHTIPVAPNPDNFTCIQQPCDHMVRDAV